jgi:hypothetical protein
VRLAEGNVWRASGGELAEGAAVDLVVRPEGCGLSAAASPDSLMAKSLDGGTSDGWRSSRRAGRGGSIEVMGTPERIGREKGL